MKSPIRRAGVIGAGVMGSGIAAHLANAGVEVVLLDIVPPNLTDEEKKDPKARNRWSAGGLDKALKAKPVPAFFHASQARLVTIGNTEDDLEKLKGCDLVVEAIIEQIEPKRALFAKLEEVLSPTCVIASNTSGLRIQDMLEGRSEGFKKRFLVMHFFNPVRHMKLLELVVGPDTDPATYERIKTFGEDMLGKGIVLGKDTPNFIGNRIGIHAMMATIHQMLEDGLTPEDVDNITGSPMGHPKSASFRTADLVGLDTFAHVAKNCFDALTNDEERDVFKLPSFIQAMLEKKILGDKTKGGFYKKGPSKDTLTFDPKTLEYRAKGGSGEIKAAAKALAGVEDVKKRIKKLVEGDGAAAKFAWKVTARGLAYAARRVGEISDDIKSIDDAMKWGYNWELGPFEKWDALGFAETVDRMEKDGIKLPDSIKKMKASGAKSFYREDGAIYDLVKGEYVAQKPDPRYATLTILRKGSAPVLSNFGAEAWDLGDGILGVTFKSAFNTVDSDVIDFLPLAADKAESDFRGLVFFNKGDMFCPGANVGLVGAAATQGKWDEIRAMVKNYQYGTQRLKYATVPVVAAPFGMTLGGGLELCFACDAVQASAETYAGLVELGVGLIPGGAGTMNMLWRALEGVPQGTNVNTYAYVTQVFTNIANPMDGSSKSAEDAKARGYFRRTDGISFDRARQLVEAKARVIGMAESGYHPPTPRAYVLPGESGIATLSMMADTLVGRGFATEHDGLIVKKLAHVLCGGVSGASHEVTEDEMLELEREAFVSLCGEPKSIERMQHFAFTQKLLRN